jgi:hypothetical protein
MYSCSLPRIGSGLLFITKGLINNEKEELKNAGYPNKEFN